MKKRNLLLLMLSTLSISSFAQLKVASNGQVLIGQEPIVSNDITPLAIGSMSVLGLNCL